MSMLSSGNPVAFTVGQVTYHTTSMPVVVVAVPVSNGAVRRRCIRRRRRVAPR